MRKSNEKQDLQRTGKRVRVDILMRLKSANPVKSQCHDAGVKT